MTFWDVLADDKLFDNLLCLIIIGSIALVMVVRSFRKDDEL